MGYCSRVLSTKSDRVHASALQAALVEAGHTGVISVTAGERSDWSQLVLRHADGLEIAVIERNPVEGNSLGARELEQFMREIAEAEPQSAVHWLRRSHNN